MQEAECHSAISRSCLKYLLQLPQPFSNVGLEMSTLAVYSAKFWSSHLRKTEHQVEVVGRLTMSLMLKEQPAYLTKIQINNPDHSWEEPGLNQSLDMVAQPLYYASLLGLDILAKLLIGIDAYVNAQGGYYGNALQAASSRGYKQIV